MADLAHAARAALVGTAAAPERGQWWTRTAGPAAPQPFDWRGQAQRAVRPAPQAPPPPPRPVPVPSNPGEAGGSARPPPCTRSPRRSPSGGRRSAPWC
ncbi:hypothetical protein ACFQV2_13550 [Actinokineospora soli]|uniref:Uncharacterized protein n=1 Tax=Actinokineospora soli TaxID=1048753 RepID=A0ABW2TNK4_9PSEU